MTFDEASRFHCLIGNNGVGKTHLIEHLARCFLWRHSLFSGSRKDTFPAIFRRAGIHGALDTRTLRLAMSLVVDGKNLKDSDEDPWGITKLEAIDASFSTQFEPRKRDHDWKVRRPVIFVGARGRGHTPNIKANELRLLGTSEAQFVAAFDRTLRGASGTSDAVEEPAAWLTARVLINPAFATDNQNDGDAVVAVLALMAELAPGEFTIERVDATVKIPLAYTNGELLLQGRPIDKLATGYTSILKIFQEIVAGYSAWSRMLPGRWPSLREVDGIVFIDELEAHLHPTWQARIVGILKRAFPATTFFVTTHSPLVVRQTEPGEAIEILRDGRSVTSRPLGSPRDWYLADVYAQAFHVEIPNAGEEAGDSEPSLLDLSIAFSESVRKFAATQVTADREASLSLYEKIADRLLPDDPRRTPLTSLRGLLG